MPLDVRHVLPHEYEVAGNVTASAWEEYIEFAPDFEWDRFLPSVADIRSRARRGAVILGAFEDRRPHSAL